ncbi:DUF58 domain-containing protein [Natribaculum luteum]|uniref:DUF58 domain-containing protein n=1 Tax=Natribaculum luteum TaxID=1586232 RepID=A0ABD5P0C5_9EURY|nr:DUF58 domain-containing protein [Natribaculum luteum]
MSGGLPTRLRQAGILLATVVLAVGFLMLVDPDVAAMIPFNLGGANAVALVGFLLAIVVARSRYGSDRNQSVVPDVEYRLETPAPGDEIDAMIYRMTELREGVIEFRERIEDRLEEVALAIITSREQCSYDQAVKRLEEGRWTENPRAAAFFGGGGAPTGQSAIERVTAVFLDSDSAYEQQLQSTVDALEAASGVGGDGPDGTKDADNARTMAASHVGDQFDGEGVTETVRCGPPSETGHWKGITAFGFAALGVGVLSAQPSVLLSSVVGFALAGYARLASPVPLSSLLVTRSVSDTTPEPGDVVDVTVTVENEYDRLLTDLRVVDRVPPAWEVVDGSPRVGTALRSGDAVTFRYSVVVQRGEYRWPVRVLGYDVSGSVESEASVEPETSLTCRPALRTTAEIPVRSQTSMYSGELNTNEGGEGLEFFSVRDYQPGDPKTRIDWKTYARSGEFTTINFRQEHAARVVFLFDCRESAYVSPSADSKHALDLSVEAAFDTFASLYEQGHLIGIAAFNGIACWLGPSAGSAHVQRVRELFATHPAFDSVPPGLREEPKGRYIDPMTQIKRQLPANTQLFLFSPLTDQYTFEVARQLDGAGHLVTIVSPDPTANRTVGQRIARLERTIRIRQLRDHGIRVVDWDAERTLELELTRASQRWTA